MEIDHAAACRFFTPGDACRLALAAYHAAAAGLLPPVGQPWVIDGESYATPADFVDAFADELAARLGLLALERLGDFRPPLGAGDVYVLAHLAAPEKMRQIIADRETELRQDVAEFGDEKLHMLRAVDNGLHNSEKHGGSPNGAA